MFQCGVLASRDAPNLTHLTGNCANCGRKLLSETPPEELPGVLPAVEEFTAARDRAMRTDWPGLLIVAAVMTTAVLSLVATKPEQLLETLVARYGLPTGALIVGAVYGGCVLVLAAVSILSLRWLKWRHMREWAAIPVLNCPHCREKLLPAHPVTATQRCPSCRNRVLANPNAEPQLVVTEG